jgi:hypothetical protein
VSLCPLSPLTFEAFAACAAVTEFVDWLADEIDGADLTGWQSLLASYCWMGYGFDLTLESRRRQRDALLAAQTPAEWAAACECVRQWSGENHRFSDDDVEALQRGSDLLGEPTLMLESLELRRAATMSKVYAALHPDRWVIYDSRVVSTMVELVGRWWAEQGEDRAACVLRFPIPRGRAGAIPPAGFVELGRTAVRQASLGLIYLSWLSRLVAEELNRRGAPLPEPAIGPALHRWTAQLVEMALFSRA